MTLLILAAVAAFVAVALLVYALAGLLDADRRLVVQRLSHHGQASEAATDPSSAGVAILSANEYSSFHSLDKMLRRSSYSDRIAMELARAGVPLRVGEYLLVRWIAAIGLVCLGSVFLGLNPAVSLVLGIMGYFLPRIYVRRKEVSRIGKFEGQLVDALLMIANSLKSGASLLQAIDLVAHEQPAPVSQEFARVFAEASVGASIENSLLDLSQRVRSYDIYLVVTAMMVQREVGGNLSEVLENISHTIRERQRLLQQVVVETAETRLSGYVIGALPIFMLFIMSTTNRGYADVLFTGPGQIILIAGAVMEILGFIIITRIVSIEV